MIQNNFVRLLKFYKLKRGDQISGGNQFCRKSQFFGPPFCVSIEKTFKNPNSSSFIRFQYILLDSEELFSDFWNFYELKRRVLISGGNQFCRKSQLFGNPLCISILKVLRTQFLLHSLDFNTFCFIQEHLSQAFEISTN